MAPAAVGLPPAGASSGLGDVNGALWLQSLAARVAGLPLLSSACGLLSAAYGDAKGRHRYLRAACEAAERGVRAAAVSGVLPVVQRLEPHVAVANTYACKGLDRIERLPILNQPTAQVVANAKGAVTGVRDTVTKTVMGAKDSVASKITGVVDRTKGAVSDGVEKTKSVVNGSIHTVLDSLVVRLMSSGLETALTTSELLVDQYLPLTEEELEKEAKKVEGFDVVQKPSCYIRLGSLSIKLRARAYQQALSRVTDAKLKSQETIARLHSAVHLIEYAKRNMHNANQKIQGAQEKLCLSWVEWKRSTGHNTADESHCAEQLQTTCHALLSSIQGLPQGIRRHVEDAGLIAGDIFSTFRSASSFMEVSDSLLTSSKGQLQKMKESLDDVMDYLVNNTPLNWLVGPFYPELTEAQDAQSQGAEPGQPGQQSGHRAP
ncbi:perilipin-2 isoform X2 [Heterocephalus glaber]|uniref:Perilipin n=1 Tax=Heterocephalus glaber TaxID=10181 RepID=A0AAX6SIA6_HETGA|nr:perilipin-2 isoform X2 [Heterocephalus glaber]